jgi:uncharacterized integral membrane protein (TIGR00698 family)
MRTSGNGWAGRPRSSLVTASVIAKKRPTSARLPAALLLAGAAVVLLPAVTAPAALALGAAVGLTVGNPHRMQTQRLAGRLLQGCVVGLGFGMSFAAVLNAGAVGLAWTAVVVISALSLGLVIGRAFGVNREVSLLISSGTGICGGSAIAAVGSAIRARGEAMSIALAVVFVLNAVALYAFPALGRLLDLSQQQFAVWAALAIHDTSSVVGAASVYGEQALQQATVLKLARALWILPVALGAAYMARRGGRDAAAPGAAIVVPWFVLLFVAAAVVRSISPASVLPALDAIVAVARLVLPLVLFLIGAGLTRTTLRTVGPLPMAQAALLWIIVAAGTLGLVLLMDGV